MELNIKRIEWTRWEDDHAEPLLVITLDSGRKLEFDSEQKMLRRGIDAVDVEGEGLPEGYPPVTIKLDGGAPHDYFQMTDDPEIVAKVSEFCSAVSDHTFEPKVFMF